MPVTDTTVLPLCELRIYRPGQGDPLTTDPGVWWYDILGANTQWGVMSLNGSGVSYLRYIPQIGLCCREWLVLKDTRLADWDVTGGGSWEERRPLVGGTGRTLRLCQIDTTADLQWEAESKYHQPADASFAISYLLAETPADHDTTTYPPYARVEWGGGWAIHYDQDQGLQLLREVDGAWQSAVHLPEPISPAEERFVFIRVQRGKICVSTDLGRQWTVYADPLGATLSTAAAKVAIRGQGMAGVFGLHQLRYFAGSYQSPARNTFVTRLYPLFPTVTVTGAAPHGSSAAAVDDSPGGLDTTLVRYLLTLTPGTSVVGWPFVHYYSPEVQAVTYRLPTVRLDGAGAYDVPLPDILTVDIDLPWELDGGQAVVLAEGEAAEPFEGNYRRRKAVLRVGRYDASGVATLSGLWSGYTTEPGCERTGFGEKQIKLTLDNATIWLKKAKWNDVQGVVPLGGQTLNAMLDMCLDYAGLPTTYRSWHASGDLITLPAGSPEDPYLWPKAGESVWDTMADTARKCGLELGCTAAGVYVTVPVDYAQPVVTQILQADPTGELSRAIQSIAFREKTSESYTAVEVRGYDERGGLLLAFICDNTAEQDTTSQRFVPWREWHIEVVPGTCTPGMIAAMAQGIAAEKLPRKFEGEIRTPLNENLARRDRVRVEGTNAGLEDDQDCMVLTLHHHLEGDPSMETSYTTAGIRRL